MHILQSLIVGAKLPDTVGCALSSTHFYHRVD